MERPLTISIIIPAYNEEGHIGACLQSIAAQTERPEEVIVVDNNSSDNTAAIAAKFPFAIIVTEKKPGLIAARNLGFSLASGDILGRINADVVLSPDWVKTVKQTIANEGYDGLTGPAKTYMLPNFDHVRTTVYSRGYIIGAEAFFNTRILWGANMAITHKAWNLIQGDLNTDDKVVHEDQDISLAIAAYGGEIGFRSQMLVSTDEMSYIYWPKLKEYWIRRWRTKRIYIAKGLYDDPLMPKFTLFSHAWRLPAVTGNGLFALASLISYLPVRFIMFLRRRHADSTI